MRQRIENYLSVTVDGTLNGLPSGLQNVDLLVTIGV